MIARYGEPTGTLVISDLTYVNVHSALNYWDFDITYSVTVKIVKNIVY